jgi:hypothetical protein
MNLYIWEFLDLLWMEFYCNSWLNFLSREEYGLEYRRYRINDHLDTLIALIKWFLISRISW